MILQVRDLHKHFPLAGSRWARWAGDQDKIRAVNGVSFEMQQGETLGIVGESGCGKTTLARCLLRLIEPSAGEVYFQAQDWLCLSPRELRRQRRRIQAIFQDPYESLNPRMTVDRIIQEPLAIHGLGNLRERRQRAARLLQMVELEEVTALRYAHELSGGQRQRVAIARALATRPDLLVADEPLSALDIPVQRKIIELLKSLKHDFQLTILFISHSLPAVRCLCDRVAVMYAGRIVELAPVGEIFSRPLHAYTRELIAAIPRPDPPTRQKAVQSRWQPLERHSTAGQLKRAGQDHWVLSDTE